MRLMRTPSVGWDGNIEAQGKEQIKNNRAEICEVPWPLFPTSDHPHDRDCFVALRAPRSDGAIAGVRTHPRHCERSEAISPPVRTEARRRQTKFALTAT